MPTPLRRAAILVFSCIVAVPLFAGFAANESFLPAIGRGSGQGGLQFYATIWATNLTGVPVHFTFDFLKQGQANPNPASFADTLAPGQTKVYENVVETKLGLNSAIGAARVTADGEVLVAERIYNQSPGTDLGATQGLFFAGVPKDFSISAGQSASIQGINQGGGENFRYNFALVETGGGSPTVNVQLFDGNGTLLGQKAYILQPYEQLQPNVAELNPGIATTNARITATVTGGSGSVLLAGAQLAAESLDSSGFEMSFRGSLLGGGGAAGVSSLNGLTGDVNLVAGNGIAVSQAGSSITIAATGGGSGGGLTLPFSGSFGDPTAPVFTVANTATPPTNSTNAAIMGIDISPSGLLGSGFSQVNAGVVGDSSLGTGVVGGGSANGVQGFGHVAGVVGWGIPAAVPTSFPPFGVVGITIGQNGAGVLGSVSFSTPDVEKFLAGVEGTADDQWGVFGHSSTSNGVVGLTDSPADSSTAGVVGMDANVNNVGYLGGDSFGVKGTTDQPNLPAVVGVSSYAGNSFGAGVQGFSSGQGIGVWGDAGQPHSWGVYGHNPSSDPSAYAGYFDGQVIVTGKLTKPGGSFKIDHPLDPAHKYLSHSFVESPDMKNIYDGVATLDAWGVATVTLPDWFEALNRDFRYQLTALGTPQPGLFISREVEGNRFTIAGGVPGARVSWMVTGIRHDAWADAHRIPVEETKPEEESGSFLHPELFGAGPEKSLTRALKKGAEPDRSRVQPGSNR